MTSAFKSEVILRTLVAAFGGSSCIVLQLPLLRIPGRDVEESGAVLHSKMYGAAPFGARAGSMAETGLGAAIYAWAAELGTVLGCFHAVMTHFRICHADRDAIRANGEIILVFELYVPLFVQINERGNTLSAVVVVNRYGVMGGVKEQLGDLVFW